MTLADYNTLRLKSRMEFINPITKDRIEGTVVRVDVDEVEVIWDDNRTTVIQRHQVRIYRDIFAVFRVL